MIDYYIYYRVRADTVREELIAAATTLLARVGEATGIHGRLLQRVGDATTWMEIYPAVAEELATRFEETLAQAADAGAFEQFLDPGTTRHVERFRPCV